MDPDRKIRYIQLYAVVDRDGNLKANSRRQRMAVYKSYYRACKACVDDGDSVVGMEINLSKEPMYILRKEI